MQTMEFHTVNVRNHNVNERIIKKKCLGDQANLIKQEEIKVIEG